jgi:hypothetical protein
MSNIGQEDSGLAFIAARLLFFLCERSEDGRWEPVLASQFFMRTCVPFTVLYVYDSFFQVMHFYFLHLSHTGIAKYREMLQSLLCYYVLSM